MNIGYNEGIRVLSQMIVFSLTVLLSVSAVWMTHEHRAIQENLPSYSYNEILALREDVMLGLRPQLSKIMVGAAVMLFAIGATLALIRRHVLSVVSVIACGVVLAASLIYVFAMK